MSFAAPLVLIALVAIPVLAGFYTAEQRRGERAAAAFVSIALRPSVTPRPAGWRRHAPMLLFALAVALLILAAARPQRSVAVPVTEGAVMLVDDMSSSMAASDVKPSRLSAATYAATRFLASMPATVRVGLIAFNQRPVLLQSPSTDHALTRDALGQLHAGGHTAIGDAINAATGVLGSLRGPNGKRPPGAIVLLSDGTSTNGAQPVAAARQAAARHIPVYTVALGTSRGTITVPRAGRRVAVPVPLDPIELRQIARSSGGEAFTASDAERLHSIYRHLAARLGDRHLERAMTAGFAGAGLLLVICGCILSLGWFGRLI
ncbi:MAG: VWA domain-containing protein [Solirubrobacteraceae bacterium]